MSLEDAVKNTPEDIKARAAVAAKEKLIQGHRDWLDARRIAEAEPRPHGPIPVLKAINGEELRDHEFTPRIPILYRYDTVVFRQGDIGEIAAFRGIGKTWQMMTLGLVASAGGEALGFKAPKACRVLHVDGEMSSEDIQKRYMWLSKALGIPLTKNLVIIGADWQEAYLPRLDTIEGQSAIEEFVKEAEFILLDNRSCLFDPDGEKDPTAWQPAQEWLLSLRRAGKGTIMAHHGNRNGGARGISKAEDVIDLLLLLSRPADYKQEQGARFLVEFKKTRGFSGDAAASFVAALSEHGWLIEGEMNAVRGAILEYLEHTAPALGGQPKSANAIYTGVGGNRSEVLKEVASLLRDGRVKNDAGRGFVVVQQMSLAPC